MNPKRTASTASRPPLLIAFGLLRFLAGCADASETDTAFGAGTDIKSSAADASDETSTPIGSDESGAFGPANESEDSDDSMDAEDAALDTPVYGEDDTHDVLCSLSDSGNQRLTYTLADPRSGARSEIDETLPYTFAWSCSDSTRSLSGNGVPNHNVEGGNFATALSEQRVEARFPLVPEHTGDAIFAGSPGYALNSVKFDPNTAGTCPDDAETDRDCSYGGGSDPWSMVATPGDTSPWRFDFGVDENDAHVQPNGQYHYHGDPVSLVGDLNPDATSSTTLVGWMNDGFPIYSLYGASDPDDARSPVVKMESSWRTIDSVPADRPSTEDFPLGHFDEDWTYEPGLGDLDACNGRFAATPEFPDGIYHYYTTETYPFIPRCLNGRL
ncbi:MAG: hypothetical protein CL927_10980 [Deltaproteobacteria bacterium]|nr:hypothetical protein [Deltaproteobacteria bacterium]